MPPLVSWLKDHNTHCIHEKKHPNVKDEHFQHLSCVTCSTLMVMETRSLTANGNVARWGGWGYGRHPLGYWLGGRVEHEVGERDRPIVKGQQAEAAVVLPCCCLQL